MSKAIIAGLDEAGRGALAGPVVAAACVLRGRWLCLPLPVPTSPLDRDRASRAGDFCPPGQLSSRTGQTRRQQEEFTGKIQGWVKGGVRIADSKCLSAQERERAFAYLTAHEAWGVGAAESALIDAEGILAATEQAMQRALAELRKIVTPTYLLIDGRDKFWFDLPHSSIIRGDQLEPSIAAASILAKVLRDRIMEEASERYPAYRFLEHKGYATPAHQQLLRIHGPCPLHRRSFLRTVCAI